MDLLCLVAITVTSVPNILQPYGVCFGGFTGFIKHPLLATVLACSLPSTSTWEGALTHSMS